MANFGWAYVNCEDTGGGSGQAAGPTGSLQFLTGANATSGSAFLLYHTSSVSNFSPSTMILSGNLVVTGAVSASVFHYQDITEIDATGSTSFGNTNDDTHMRTGSLVVTEAGAGAATNFVLSASATQKVVSVAGFAGKYTAISDTNIALTTDSHIYGITRTSATSLVVPAANTVPTGLIWTIKDEVTARTGASNNITLTSSSPVQNLFDGAPTYILTGTMPAISIYSNGTNWFVF
tara:strand:- start:2723 stop:3427 length:705 start_codon:yes stop_codon:yes gene_type:complete